MKGGKRNDMGEIAHLFIVFIIFFEQRKCFIYVGHGKDVIRQVCEKAINEAALK